MKAILRWSALGLGAFLVLGTLATMLLLTTPVGPWTVNRLLPATLPEGITVEGLSGQLGGQLELTRVRVEMEGLALEAHDVSTEYSPWGLLLPPRTLDVSLVRARKVMVRQQKSARPPAPPDDEPFPLGAPQLPVDLRVGAVEVVTVELRAESGWHARVTDLEGAARWGAGGAQIDALQLRGALIAPDEDQQLVEIEASAEAYWPTDPQDDAHLMLRVDGTSDHLPPLAATVDLAGALGTTPTLRVTTAAPVVATLAVRAEGLERVESLRADGALRLEEALDLARLDPRLPPVLVRGEVDARLDQERLSTHPDLTVDLTAFDMLAEGQEQILVEGDVDIVRDTLTTVTDRLTILLGNAGGSAGRMELSGTLDPRLNLATSITFDRIDPGWAAPAWAGQLSGKLAVTGSLPAGPEQMPTLGVQDLDLQGELRGQPVALQGAAALAANGRITIDKLIARSGEARLTAQGQASLNGQGLPVAADLRTVVRIPDLAQVLPGGAGRLAGEAHLRGDLGNPQVSATIESDGLELDRVLTLQQARAEINVDGRDQLDVDAQVRSLGLAGITLDTASLQASGRLAQHQLRLSVSAPEGTVNAAVRGAADLEQARWTGLFENFSVNALEREWRLADDTDRGEAAPRLTLSADRQALTPICLAAPPEPDQLCIEGEAAADALDAKVSVRAVALQPWANLLGLPLRVDASLAGDASIQRPKAGLPTVSGTLRLTPGELSLEATDGDAFGEALRWDEVSAQIDTVEDAVVANATIDLTDAGRLDGEARTARALLGGAVDPAAQSVDASLRGALRIPERLANAIPGVSALRGQATVDLQANGTLRAPRLGGTLEVTALEADIAPAGLRLQDGELTLRGDGQVLDLSGSIGTGEGTLRTNAHFEQGDDGWRGSLGLDGERVLVMDTPQVRAFITPDLRAQLDTAKQTVRLEGSVHVPEAQLRPVDLSNAVRASSDEVIVGQAAQQPDSGWTTDAQITLSLGDDVTYRGGGFRGHLRGQLAVRERPGEIPTGNGELSVADARFSVFGQTLDVNRGRVVFISSPLTNPGLDVQASRSIDEVTVRVDVRGSLREQVITVSSTPALPQADALSYLIVGKPVSELQGESDSELLADAARQGGLAGADLLARRVGRRIGLDEFSVEQDQGGENAQLVVGKYLSPRLYVRYGLGLFETLNTWLLRYDLSQRWAVETETGAQNSVDVLYSIEN